MKKSMIIAAFMTLTLMGMLMPLTPITAEGAEEGTHPPPTAEESGSSACWHFYRRMEMVLWHQ